MRFASFSESLLFVRRVIASASRTSGDEESFSSRRRMLLLSREREHPQPKRVASNFSPEVFRGTRMGSLSFEARIGRTFFGVARKTRPLPAFTAACAAKYAAPVYFSLPQIRRTRPKLPLWAVVHLFGSEISDFVMIVKLQKA